MNKIHLVKQGTFIPFSVLLRYCSNAEFGRRIIARFLLARSDCSKQSPQEILIFCTFYIWFEMLTSVPEISDRIQGMHLSLFSVLHIRKGHFLLSHTVSALAATALSSKFFLEQEIGLRPGSYAGLRSHFLDSWKQPLAAPVYLNLWHFLRYFRSKEIQWGCCSLTWDKEKTFPLPWISCQQPQWSTGCRAGCQPAWTSTS